MVQRLGPRMCDTFFIITEALRVVQSLSLSLSLSLSRSLSLSLIILFFTWIPTTLRDRGIYVGQFGGGLLPLPGIVPPSVMSPCKTAHHMEHPRPPPRCLPLAMDSEFVLCGVNTRGHHRIACRPMHPSALAAALASKIMDLGMDEYAFILSSSARMLCNCSAWAWDIAAQNL